MDDTNKIIDETIDVGNNINETLLTQSEQLDATLDVSHRISYFSKMSIYILNRMTWSGWFLSLFSWRPTLTFSSLKFWKMKPKSDIEINMENNDNFYKFDSSEIEMITKTEHLEDITNNIHNILNDQYNKIDQLDVMTEKNITSVNKGIEKEGNMM